MPVAATTALLAAIGVLLLVFAWRAVRELPLVGRILARLVLAAVIVVPFLLLITMKMERQGGGDRTASRPPPTAGAPAPGKTGEQIDAENAARETARRMQEAAERDRASRERSVEERSGAAREVWERAAREQASEDARKKAAEAKPAAPPPPAPGPDVARPPAPPQPTTQPAPRSGDPSDAPGSGRTRSVSPPSGSGAPSAAGGEAPATGAPPAPPASSPAPAPPPAPAPAAPSPPAPKAAEAKEPDWDVVPVFFGTDRAIQADPKRLQFSWERGRKLVMGRALVTVPRAHQVPQVERPWVVKVPYFQVTIYQEAEDPKKHFTMQELKATTREELLALVRQRLATSARFKDHALIFVHGYNTGFDNAVYRTAQIAYDLKFDGAPFLYSWPSGGAVASYTYDRESAGQSEPYLRQFLEMVVKETGAKSVSVIAHSMGNQPLLQVLKELKLQAPAGVEINQVISAAPDVDRDNFENLARTIQGFAKGVTLYAASNDRALNVSRRFHGGVPRAGDVPEQGPLVLPGLDTIDVSAASMDGLGINHSGYAENNALLNDIALLIQTGERPPDKRVPILEKVATDRGTYWRYPAVR